MNTLIIASAPDIRALTEIFGQYCPQVRLLCSCTSLQEGLAAIHRWTPDLVFGAAGEYFPALLNQTMSGDFSTVILANDEKQVLEALRYDVLGCVLRPFSEAAIVEAVAKAARYHRQRLMFRQMQALIDSMSLTPASRRASRIPLPQNQYTIEYVPLHQIAHIEAERQYCVFNLVDNRRITTSRNIGEYEKMLGGYPFLRVHRSHIVNLDHVRSFHRQDEMLEMPNGKKVVVARNMRDHLLAQLAG